MTYYEKQGITKEEFNRISKSLNQQKVQVHDLYGNRWVRCHKCGQAITINDTWKYGGVNEMNIGECRECYIKNLKGRLKI